MVGITRGQTIRLSVVNAIPYDSAFPPGPIRCKREACSGRRRATGGGRHEQDEQHTNNGKEPEVYPQVGLDDVFSRAAYRL